MGKLLGKAKELIDAIENYTDDDKEKVVWDKALDIVEIIVEATPTKIDNFILIPLIKIFRRRFDIPDND